MKSSVRSLIIRLALAAAGGIALTASVSAQEVLIAPSAPPPPRYEVVPAPRVGYVWDRGHWRWDQGRYVWVPGHWQLVRAGHRWVPGRWAARGGQWVWVEGYWR